MQIYLVKNLPENKKARNNAIDFTLDSLRTEYPGQEIRLQSGVKEQFDAGYKNAVKYIPLIKKELIKHDMPEDLAYLPFVESAFNPNARSKVNALGMWQIMPKTGKIFGCKNKKHLFDPVIATGVAVKILKNNYEETGDWHLALMSYNHGVEGIKKAQDLLATSNYCTITENYRGKSFKFASKNFLAQFLAVRRIMQCKDF
jgi:membrane-bound lytic murein transglycosylase D